MNRFEFVVAVLAMVLVLLLKSHAVPEKPKVWQVERSTTVESVDERMLGLLEMVFNQPLKDLHIFSTTVTLSAYTASVDETNENPHLTATMTPSRIGLAAVSRDLIEAYGLHRGQTIILPPYGAFQVQDVMNARWKLRIDLLHATKKAARLFGVKPNMKVIWIPWDGKSLIISMNKTLNQGG